MDLNCKRCYKIISHFECGEYFGSCRECFEKLLKECKERRQNAHKSQTVKED